MGRIQTNIGLITGLPILDTVDQLMAIQARPRDLITARTQQLRYQQEAVASLTAKVLGVQLAAERLGKTSVFEAKSASSSRPDLIQVTSSGNPAVGTYQLTPVQRAQTHQLLSTGFASLDTPVGAGRLTLRTGGFVDRGVNLDGLNGGEGVRRGEIRIVDSSGASATIDLRFAKTIDDVLDAVNASQDIAVTAVATGDAIRLIDNTGQTTANLRVHEVGAGSTAADLGLAGIDVAASEVTGQDVVSLHDGLALGRLNDGNGLSIRSALPDLTVSFRDGSDALTIDFHRAATPEEQSSATLLSANGPDASLAFQAAEVGAEYDGVTIRFIDDGTVAQGSETVVYDDTQPENKTLTFNVEAGATTANDIIAALAGDQTASQLFTAQTAAGGDGTELIDLSDTAATSGGAAIAARTETTLGKLLQTINEANPTRLRAELSPDGDRLLLHDLTNDLGGSFTVTSPLDGGLAEDLGLTGTAVGGVLTSRRLLSGLKTTLLSTLNGGRGPGQLGEITITDRSGVTDTVDLSAAETLDDVIAAINAASVGVTASVNPAHNGVLLTDTTGQAASNLVVTDTDGSGTANLLGIAFDEAQTSVDSGTLHRQVIHEATLLETYNGGRGVSAGSIVILDSSGAAKSFRINADTATTVGDLMDLINAESFGVTARINDAGDGIALIDTAGGDGSLTVQEVGDGTTARDLRLSGAAEQIDLDGTPAQMVDGSTTLTIDISDTDTLSDLVQRINDLDAGVTAGIFSDGSGTMPHRLSLRSDIAGSDGELLVDDSAAGFSLYEIAAARDALLVYGSVDSSTAGILMSSTDNRFENIIDGLTFTVSGESTSPVDVTVATTDDKLISEVRLFVDQYNSLRDTLDEMTFYNEVDNTTGVLFGSAETLRIDSDLSRLLTGRFLGAGSFQSLEQLGISVGDDGKIDLDESELAARYATDPDAVQQFFTAENSGVAARFRATVETLAGEDNSLLINRSVALQAQVDVLTQRTDLLDARLEKQRERLLLDFYRMEMAISKMQNNLSVLSALNLTTPTLSGSTNNSS